MKQHFFKLDGARGLAILFVLFSHAAPLPGLALFSGIGHRGVYLFFVLSAFLLTLPMLDRDWKWFASTRTWRIYFLRRFLRVYPLYALVLVASWFVTTQLQRGWLHNITTRQLKTALLLDHAPSIFWSVPIEAKYYLVLPFAAFFLGVVCRRDFWRAATWTAGFLVLYYLFAHKALFMYPHMTLALYLPIFLLGSLAALFQNQFAERGNNHRVFSLGAASLLAFAVFTGPEWNELLTGHNRDFATDSPYFVGPFWCAFVLCALRSGGAVARVLQSAPLRFLGKISFSLYLLHMPIIGAALLLPLPGLFKTLFFFAFTLFAAWLSYTLVEAPLMRLAHRTGREPEKSPSSTARVLATET